MTTPVGSFFILDSFTFVFFESIFHVIKKNVNLIVGGLITHYQINNKGFIQKNKDYLLKKETM